MVADRRHIKGQRCSAPTGARRIPSIKSPLTREIFSYLSIFTSMKWSSAAGTALGLRRRDALMILVTTAGAMMWAGTPGRIRSSAPLMSTGLRFTHRGLRIYRFARAMARLYQRSGYLPFRKIRHAGNQAQRQALGLRCQTADLHGRPSHFSTTSLGTSGSACDGFCQRR